MAKKKNSTTTLVVRTAQPARPKAQKKKKKQSVPRGVPSYALSTVHRTVCSVTDPFCVHARGGKWLDDTTQPSLPYQTKMMIPVTTDANGAACVALFPAYPAGYSIATAIVGSTATFAGNLVNWDAAYAASQYRLVTGGTKFISTVSPMNAQGYVVQTEWGSGLQDISSLALYTYKAPARYTQPLADRRPVHYIFRPSGAHSREYTSYIVSAIPVNAITTLQDWSWTSVSIAGGPASTTVGYVEVTLNFELQFLENDPLNFFATKSPGSNILVNTVSNHVMADKAPFYSGTTEYVSSAVSAAAIGALRRAMPMIKGAVVTGVTGYAGPLAGTLTAGALGHIPDVD